MTGRLPMADQLLARISDQAGLLSWYVGVWNDLGYASPEPGQHPVPPLGERSAECLEGARRATGVIDAITRDLAELRAQLAGEVLADQDARAARRGDGPGELAADRAAAATAGPDDDPLPLSELAAELESELAAEAVAEAWDELGIAPSHADLIAEIGGDAARPPSVIPVAPGTVVTFRLPGLTGIRVDTGARLIAVDGLSGEAQGEPLHPGYVVRDLRDGIYGGFHRLLPAGECLDADCIAAGEHDADRRGPGES